MTDTEPPAPPTKPSARPSFAAPDGFTLALATAACYGAAFAFEQGYADYFGYPDGLIEVSITTLLLTAIAFSAAALIGYHTILVVTALSPARVARILVFNFFNVYLGVALSFIFLATTDLLAFVPWWLRIWPLLIAAYFLSFVLIQVYRHDRAAVSHPSGILERYWVATQGLVDAHWRSSTRGDSVLDRTTDDPAWASGLAKVYGILILTFLLYGAALGIGELAARAQRMFLVAEGGPTTLIAIRYYGDNIVAAAFNRPSKSVLTRFVLLPSADTSRVWVRTLLVDYRILKTQ